MSDITSSSSTSAKTVEQSEQQKMLEQSQENIPSEENKQRFAQKLQGQNKADDKKKAQKNEEQNKESKQAKELQAKELKNAQKNEQQGLKEIRGKAPSDSTGATLTKTGGLKEKDNQAKDSQAKADAILQSLGGAQTTQTTAQSQAQATNLQATASSQTAGAERLLNEFQSVADRVMLTENNLQQGGSIRLQLSNEVLPGTSVTFSMVGGALHATFSGSNKQSLEKILKHRDKMTEHVQASSGVRVVVEAKEEENDNAKG